MPLQRKSKQRGFSLLGLLVGVSLAAMAFVLAVRVFPTVIEYMAVQKAVQKAAMQGNTPDEVRAVFAKAAGIESITALDSDALDISKQEDKVVVAFAYQRELHLIGPAFLTLKYQGRSK